MKCIKDFFARQPLAEKCSALVYVVSLTLLFLAPSLAQVNVDAAQGTNVVFLIDISKSMLQDNMFERVKRSVQDYIGKITAGDHLLILTFGEEVSIVFDDEVTDTKQIAEVIDRMSNLRPSSDWTYMTNALDKAATQARRLQDISPRSKHLLYLFTDGQNDPPPWVRNKEGYMDFIGVLNKHFKFFTSEKTFLYILSLREPEPALTQFADTVRSGGGHVEIAKELPKVIKEVQLSTTELDFGTIQIDDEKGEGEAKIAIERLTNAEGAELYFSFAVDTAPYALAFTLSPEGMVCRSKGQSEVLYLRVSGQPSSSDWREYSGNLHIATHTTGVNISPILVRCSFSLSKKKARPNWLAYLIAALAVAGLVFLLWIFIPRPSKLIWIKTEDGRVFSGKVRRGQKLWLDKHPTSEFLEVGFPHHYVTAGKKQSLIVCDDTERLKVTFGKEVTLSTTEGEKMTATFFESDPSKQEAQQGEATPGHLPGPMDKI